MTYNYYLEIKNDLFRSRLHQDMKWRFMKGRGHLWVVWRKKTGEIREGFVKKMPTYNLGQKNIFQVIY